MDIALSFGLRTLRIIFGKAYERLTLLRVPGVNFDPRGAKRVIVF